MNVRGILMVSWPTHDGRQPWHPTELARALADFDAGRAIPILDGHGGPPVGRLTWLYRSGEGFRFHGEITDPEVVDRLAREGSVELSAETPDPLPNGEDQPWHISTPHREDAGYLKAVAVLPEGQRAARPGSLLWWVDENGDAPDELTREYQGGKVRRVYEQPALLTRSFGRVTSVR